MDLSLYNKKNILIVAETEFERSFCKSLVGKKFTAVLKTGLSPADIVGVKLMELDELEETNKEECQA
jgi:hypothetical protein